MPAAQRQGCAWVPAPAMPWGELGVGGQHQAWGGILLQVGSMAGLLLGRSQRVWQRWDTKDYLPSGLNWGLICPSQLSWGGHSAHLCYAE